MEKNSAANPPMGPTAKAIGRETALFNLVSDTEAPSGKPAVNISALRKLITKIKDFRQSSQVENPARINSGEKYKN